MLKKKLVATFLLLLPSFVYAQQGKQRPQEVTVCALRADPAKWNRQYVRVKAFISHGLEDSSVVDPACGHYENGPWIWMDYGGRIGSGTMYFGPTSSRHREQDILVEGMSLPLHDNAQFQNLDNLLLSRPHSRGATVVEATVEGHFFAGKQKRDGTTTTFGGFGHFGCCSLFIIEKVNAVAERPLNDQEMQEFAMAFPLRPIPRHVPANTFRK